MKIQTLAGTRTLSGEPPRSTAYYYADLERLKRKNGQEPIQEVIVQNPDELSEYVDTNEVINDGAVREVPPLRDRVRHWSLPDYNTPENSRKIEETYSTAGTFPMPEPKEKEPLLAELEVVGRLPLTQLDSASGVRRSRSWYLCCPNVAEEEISRESSWRYSSLRPVTAPPIAGQNGFHMMVATQSSGPDDLASLRAERDGLARALAAERQRAATAARAHDARLAELHGVIAELVRRRAHDKHARAIPEEEVSDECESTTQPAGELDNDADRSRTEQNDTLSALSPAELPTPHESKVEPEPDDTTDTSTHLASRSECAPDVEERAAPPADLPTDAEATDACDTSLNLSERDSDPGRGSARCCDGGGDTSAGGSCERERGSPDEHRLYTHSAGRCESRQAKLASRVRLRKTEDDDSNRPPSDDGWCAEAAERLALDVCAHADLREALLAAQHHEGGGGCAGCAGCAGRVARLLAERRVLRCALSRAADTAHRLYCACALHESTSVALCCALRAADRALEAYDVLLALAETCHAPRDPQRSSAELVARQLLARLDAERGAAAIGEPLLSPGPWLQHHAQVGPGAWSRECEARLRAHAARLKADTVALRGNQPPKMFSYHDVEESELVAARAGCSAAEMEAAVALQDALHHTHLHQRPKGSSPRRSRRTRHWLDTRASETDL